MKDVSQIMRQAQAMQAKIAEAQAKLEAMEVEGSAGGGLVKVRMTGKTALLALCASQFEVFVTVDKNLPNQQNLTGLDLAVIVLIARSNRLEDLLPLVPALLTTIPTCNKGAATFVDTSR